MPPQTMDFFTCQDQARKRTGLLIFYFSLSIILTITAIYLTVSFAFRYFDYDIRFTNNIWNPELFFGTTGIILFIIITGTLYKLGSLSGNSSGEKVARLVGGQQINPNTTDFHEKRILNIVEEMAIASGMPVPPVYLIPEEGINAFAAGLSPGNAVIGITKGCIENLTRDELQGVIAHEFSHIFNGDMRLNIRLIGTLFGILMIAVTGTNILRIMGHTRTTSRSSKKGGGSGLIIIAVAGLILMIVGYIGQFFAKMIQRAISRQREYLADASAVQFTRNPAGIAGALKKIGGLDAGSKIKSGHAKEMSHMFFSEALTKNISAMMSTHPNLVDRIRRIDPSFNGKFQKVAPSASSKPQVSQAEGISQFARAKTIQQPTINTEQMISRVGTLNEAHVSYASEMLSALPGVFRQEVREPFGARAVIYMLLLDSNINIREKQLNYIRGFGDPTVNQIVRKLLGELPSVKPEVRLPLLDLCLPALRQLSAGQYKSFLQHADYLARIDDQISIFEFTLKMLITRHYRIVTEEKTHRPGFRPNKASIRKHIHFVLTSLANQGHTRNPQKAQQAFAAGMARLNNPNATLSSFSGSFKSETFGYSLEYLSYTKITLRKRILEACITCITSDRRITIEEAELIRAIADTLECPMPPFLPGELQQAA